MNTIRQISNSGCSGRIAWLTAVAFQLSLLLFLSAGFSEVQALAADEGSPLTPWLGVWDLEDKGAAAVGPDIHTVVEIRPAADGKGLDMSRKAPNQADVREIMILDGSRQPVQAQDCSGWRSASLVPEANAIASSSEMSCKDTGSITTSNLRMILGADEMVDVMALKTRGQTRLAIRHLRFREDLPAAPGLEPGWVGVSRRTEAAAPWKLDAVIDLSRKVDTQVLQAALLEKKSRIELKPATLRQMKAAALPQEIIDLVVALSYPDQFHIEKNGAVELRPWIVSSSSNNSYYPPAGFVDNGRYAPNIFYNCYSPYGFYYGLPYSGACMSYYSPFWWDYPIYVPAASQPVAAGASTPQGYIQIEPARPVERFARPRNPMNARGGSAAAGVTSVPGYDTGNYNSGTYSTGSSGGGYSSGGGGGASSSGSPSASPGGYSSGSSSGGTAVPK